MGFRNPTKEERSGDERLVNQRIAIYWDGDNVYYPGRVVSYNAEAATAQVLYENDESGEQYEESLAEVRWLLWDESAENHPDCDKSEDGKVMTQVTTNKAKRSGPRLTYTEMVIEAVTVLGDRDGCSLPALRKYIQSTYNLGKQQTASFNNLTLKAVSKAVAVGDLEPVPRARHSYRLSAGFKRKREAKAGQTGTSKLAGSSSKRHHLDFYSGTPAEHNQQLRAQLAQSRRRRDEYLSLDSRLAVLRPFLPTKNYFYRRELKLAGKTEIEIASILDAVDEEDEEDVEENNVEIGLTVAKETESLNGTNEILQNDSGATEAAPLQNMKANESIPGAILSNNAIDSQEPWRAVGNNVQSALSDVPLLSAPSGLIAQLHQHQQWGISWLAHRFVHGLPMILADQMGLGKTLQTIGMWLQLRDGLGVPGPHLCVVPLSVLSNWMAEIERFAPSLRTVRFHGPKSERNRIKREEMISQECDVVLTTFEVAVSEATFLKKRFLWTTLVVDEGHRLKNASSRLSERLRGLSALGKVILTGTPVQNNMVELWALLHFLAPEIFPQSCAAKFAAGFDPLTGKMDGAVLNRAKALLDLFMLRRVKSQVSIKLPGKREVTLLVPLTDRQKVLYKLLLGALDGGAARTLLGQHSETDGAVNDDNRSNGENNGAAVSAVGSKAGDWRALMNLLMQLRKVCNHTYLLDEGDSPDPYVVDERLVGGSGKLLLLDRVLPRLREDGHRVLLFSQFTGTLDLLEDYCRLRGLQYARLDGETSRVRRRLEVRRFSQPQSRLFIFLISTRAGGLGLNLAAADTVILYDSDWNPQMDLQATERAHRIGQTKPVRVYRLVSRGSVEQRMVLRAGRKMVLSTLVAESQDPGREDDDAEGDQDTGPQAGAGMSQAELLSVLRDGASAVLADTTTATMTDDQLDELLERGPAGRDNFNIAPAQESSASGFVPESSYSSAGPVDGVVDVCGFDEGGKTAVLPVEALLNMAPRDIDLRQLEGVLYAKAGGGGNKRSGVDSGFVSELETTLAVAEPGSKRLRKERIVMIDGAGSGYGRTVPVFADTLPVTAVTLEADDADSVPRRRRQWTHMTFCALCGMQNKPPPPPPPDRSPRKKQRPTRAVQEPEPVDTRCAHCPLVFHESCLGGRAGFKQGLGNFVCPHHKCGVCLRATAAAGGLLFRCTGCLAAYCEDCLPQEEVLSVGRCEALETLDYDSKQAYFIRCPACSAGEGGNGLLVDTPEVEDTVDDGENREDNADDGGNLEKEEGERMATQEMRIVWEEVLPEPEPEHETVKVKKGRVAAGGDGGDFESKISVDRPEQPRLQLTARLPHPCPLSVGLDQLCSHPTLQQMIDAGTATANGIADSTLSLANGSKDNKAIAQAVTALDAAITAVRVRVERERYRSASAFAADVRAALSAAAALSGAAKSDARRLLVSSALALHTLFIEEIEPHLQL